MSILHLFRNFDDEAVFAESQNRAVDEKTRNFVVDFGKDEAQIAFDLEAGDLQTIFDAERPPERPVRWINIWAPNRQLDLVDLLGSRYKFSPRLLAIVQSVPEFEHQPKEDIHVSRFRMKPHHKDDLEVAAKSIDSPKAISARMIPNETSHYGIAKKMVSYQSVDMGTHFLCVGANWMHQASKAKRDNDDSIVSKAPHQRLWSWLVLCDDHTVITLHEDPGPVNNLFEIQSMRGNTISVLSQLSTYGHLGAEPVSMQSVRQALDLGAAAQAHPGVEGASNLFYYLFDDWRAVYASIAAFQKKLEDLQTSILGDLSRKSNTTPDITIIPRLHMLGREIRVKQHLYEGYHNLIQRILEPKVATVHGTSTPMSISSHKGVVLAKSANQRFERLGDRLQLLILSEIQEFLVEKEALISTYFNINAQKDSEATARLTRSATLLAKLSVLFLPVSLMTAYFSVQINDLEGVYTARDYWTAFAVIMSISFALVFLLSKGLMWVTEILDAWVKGIMKACKRAIFRQEKEE